MDRFRCIWALMDSDEMYRAMPLTELNAVAKRHLITNTHSLGKW